MNRALLLLLSSMTLMACSGNRDAAPPTEMSALTGQETYDAVCASCHDTGVDGAPVTGNLVDWMDRSPLWQAVLTEHAKNGYLEMPARGGNPQLTDHAVSSAVEYMLSRTFPAQLPD